MRIAATQSALVLATLAVAAPAMAQEKVTVASLIQAGYSVVSAFMTPLGPALFLQGESDVYFCVTEEKPDTATVATLYCKLVE